MYFNEQDFKKVIKQIKDEQINLIIDEPTDPNLKMFDVYKFKNKNYYSKIEIDNYLLKQIRNAIDTLGID